MFEDVLSKADSLAKSLIEGGLLPVRCRIREANREIMLWETIVITINTDNQVTIAYNPPGASQFAAHMNLQFHIGNVRPRSLPVEEITRLSAAMLVKNRLFVYGPAFAPATDAVVRILVAHPDYVSLTDVWRNQISRWFLDPNIDHLSRRAYGVTHTFADYSRLARNKNVAERIAANSPKLMPVLGWLLLGKDEGWLGRFEEYLYGRTGLSPINFLDGLRRSFLAKSDKFPEGPDVGDVIDEDVADDDLARLLEELDPGYQASSELFFTPAAWRLLLRLPTNAVRLVFSSDSVRELVSSLTLISCCAASGESIPLPLFRSLISCHMYFDRRQGGRQAFDAYARFIRLAARTYQSALNEPQGGHRVLQQLIGINDWLRHDGITQGNPTHTAGWQALLRLQEAWHVANPRRHDRHDWGISEQERREAKWNCSLDSCVIDGCAIRPLVCYADLEFEGEAMQHCVKTYLRQCISGSSQIYSLHSSVGRSTLELSRQGNTWRISQLRGTMNATAPESHIPVARVIASRVRAASEQQRHLVSEESLIQ
jgi:hypothetical protein